MAYETVMKEIWPKVSAVMRSSKGAKVVKTLPFKAHRGGKEYVLHDDIEFGDVVSGSRIATSLILNDYFPEFYVYKNPSGKKRVAVYRSAKKIKVLKRAKCPCEAK
jgi:hypothetical protein